MKRVVCNVLVLALVAMTLLSCESNSAKKTLLKMDIEKTQKELPLKLGSMGELTGLTYDDDVVTITYLLNENLNDIEGLIKDSTLVKENFQCMVARNNNMQKMVKQMAGVEASLVLKYKGKTSGSRIIYKDVDGHPIMIHRPHPGNIIKEICNEADS